MIHPRPRYHFTPLQGFMNDPNGLVFYDGEYHLFYQHNPFGDTWGHMSWGHAVSRDLVGWEHLPVALAEEEGVMIFSGSAVVDWQNTSEFGSRDNPPLVAAYTGHSAEAQTQDLACSTDRGRTWTKYAGNPVVSIGSANFRDPKVFWHEPTRRWVMAVVLADRHQVRFYASPDLKAWTHLSDFGPAGAVDGDWECPDLFPLPLEGEPGTAKWVLKVDALKGTGAQYFVGRFDGTRFINEQPDDLVLRVDCGADFYAAQSWSDEPRGRRLWIGWLSSWEYANDTPTSPWRGMFSIPRELSLRRTPHGPRLVQQPVEELQRLRRPVLRTSGPDLAALNARLAEVKLDPALEMRARFIPGNAHEFGLRLCTGASEETRIGYDARAQELFIDRTRSGESGFSPGFAAVQRGPLAPEQGRIEVHMFMDTCSVEVFGNSGQLVLSDLVFPAGQAVRLELYSAGGDVDLESVQLWSLT